jgi:uncharacterized protein
MILITVRVLTNVFDKSRGMIGWEKASPIFFTTRFGIHTFGMRFPIDVLILDSHFRVVKMAPTLPPNRVLFWLPLFDKVIEIPAGEIQKKNIHVGSIITIEKVK